MENKQIIVDRKMTCNTCLIPKNFSEFHTDSRLKSGIKSKCKDCYRLYYLSAEYRQRRVRQSGESIRRGRDKLTDNYVIRQICHHNNLTPDDVRKFPELIKAQRQVILTNRIIKNEKTKHNQ